MKNSHLLLLAMISTLALNAAPEKVEKIKLEVEYPEPLVKGTEIPKGQKNLEKSRAKGSAPAPFMIPKGCTNLAEEKYVTASDEDPSEGDLDMIVDGDADGNEYVQLKSGLQWVQIDLEEIAQLYAIQLWHYHAEARVYYDIIIQVSDDPDFLEGVTTIFNNDHDNSSGLGKGTDKNYIEEFYGKTIDAKGVKGQHVRFYSNGSSGDKANHYIEIQIHGKEVKK
jgi:hypothetical protein